MEISDNKRYFWYVVAILFGIASVIPMAVSADTLKVVVQDQNGMLYQEQKYKLETKNKQLTIRSRYV